MRSILLSLALFVAVFVPSVDAQTSKAPVGSYPPIQDYLMPQASEIPESWFGNRPLAPSYDGFRSELRQFDGRWEHLWCAGPSGLG